MVLTSLVRRLSPFWAVRCFHWLEAWAGAVRYGFPSRRLIVIGVTGTNGKSTTVAYVAKVLAQTGAGVGYVSTATVSDGRAEGMNEWKLTTPGRFHLQRLMRQMLKNGCRYGVLEVSSEGLIQYRHVGVNFDVAVFTNLTPEHIERHGGFERYRRAKGMLFRHLTGRPRKTFGKQAQPKVIVANGDDQHAGYYLAFAADEKVVYGIQNTEHRTQNTGGDELPLAINHQLLTILATDVSTQPWSSSFNVGSQRFEVKLGGQFNAYNALAAVAVGRALGVSLERCAAGVASLTTVPGRMERIEAGQPFTALVDYAPEPESMRQLQQALRRVPHGKIIHVFGSAGGGRDRARRPILGQMVAAVADVAVVTNEDPYDENPRAIIDQIVAGTAGGKAQVVVEPDRRLAIRRAVELAQPGDLVVVTGKACEQWICWEGGRRAPWDDRRVLAEELARLGLQQTQ